MRRRPRRGGRRPPRPAAEGPEGRHPPARRQNSSPFLQHPVHALLAVDRLGHAEVHGQRAELVGVGRREVGAGADEGDHLAQRLLHREVEILVQAHGDEVGLRLGAGELQHRILGAAALHQRQAEMPGQADLQRVDADLAVALHAMAVAGGEQRALVEHGQEQRGALGQFLVVEVAADGARFLGVDHPPVGRRGHAHHAEEGRERQVHPAFGRPEGQAAGHGLAVHRDVQHAAIGEVLGQRAEQGAEAAEAPVGAELDLLDVDAQRVAGLGAADLDGAGDDMGAQARQLLVHFAQHRGTAIIFSCGGITSGPPERHSRMTSSPGSIEATGGKEASKAPQRQLASDAATRVGSAMNAGPCGSRASLCGGNRERGEWRSPPS